MGNTGQKKRFLSGRSFLFVLGVEEDTEKGSERPKSPKYVDVPPKRYVCLREDNTDCIKRQTARRRKKRFARTQSWRLCTER